MGATPRRRSRSTAAGPIIAQVAATCASSVSPSAARTSCGRTADERGSTRDFFFALGALASRLRQHRTCAAADLPSSPAVSLAHTTAHACALLAANGQAAARHPGARRPLERLIHQPGRLLAPRQLRHPHQHRDRRNHRLRFLSGTVSALPAPTHARTRTHMLAQALALSHHRSHAPPRSLIMPALISAADLAAQICHVSAC